MPWEGQLRKSKKSVSMPYGLGVLHTKGDGKRNAVAVVDVHFATEWQLALQCAAEASVRGTPDRGGRDARDGDRRDGAATTVAAGVAGSDGAPAAVAPVQWELQLARLLASFLVAGGTTGGWLILDTACACRLIVARMHSQTSARMLHPLGGATLDTAVAIALSGDGAPAAVKAAIEGKLDPSHATATAANNANANAASSSASGRRGGSQAAAAAGVGRSSRLRCAVPIRRRLFFLPARQPGASVVDLGDAAWCAHPPMLRTPLMPSALRSECPAALISGC